MNLRGQSTVEPMLAVTGVLFGLVMAAHVWSGAFQSLIAALATWIATHAGLA